jgi:hypothetical protein
MQSSRFDLLLARLANFGVPELAAFDLRAKPAQKKEKKETPPGETPDGVKISRLNSSTSLPP